jgi:hypothetical protein
MRTLLLIALALVFTGCHRDEEAYVRRTVNSVGASALLADAAHRASERSDETLSPINPSSLPASFIAFKPVETLRVADSFFIITARWVQHRVGVYVQPLTYPEPENGGHWRHVKLAPGVYFVSS